VPWWRRRRSHVPSTSSTVAATVISTGRPSRESPPPNCSLGRAAASTNRSTTARGPGRDFPAACRSPAGSIDRAARLGLDVRPGARGETRARDELSPATRARFAVVGGDVRTATEPDAFVECTPPDPLACREAGRVALRLTTGRADGFPASGAAVASDRDSCCGSSSDTDSVRASASTTSVGGATVKGAATGGASTGTGGAATGGGCRAGNRPSGSTYPFGSAATRTPR
jgi:hypothetical protein